MVPCFTSGLLMKKCAASMISATPALLSAPSSVVPSVVMMSLPIWFFSAGVLGEADHLAGIARQRDVAAAIVLHHLRLDVLAGDVGRGVHVRAEADHRHLLGRVGRDRPIDVAVIVEMGVRDAAWPCSSVASTRPRSFCFSVDGEVGDSGSDWVSMVT